MQEVTLKMYNELVVLVNGMNKLHFYHLMLTLFILGVLIIHVGKHYAELHELKKLKKGRGE